MKKVFYSLVFAFGVLFFTFFGVNLVHADSASTLLMTVTPDIDDSRKISINFSNIDTFASAIKVYEAKTCTTEEGCEDVTVGDNNYRLIKLHSVVFTCSDGRCSSDNGETFEYTITSEGDGTKILYAEQLDSLTVTMGSDFAGYYEYKLTTIGQRTVLNANSLGSPTYLYDGVQYTPVRLVTLTVNLYDIEKQEDYTDSLYICEKVMGSEITACGEYSTKFVNSFDYYISSYGDGEKTLNIYIVKRGTQPVDQTKLTTELPNKADLIVKKITLDTLGPVITVTGGDWIRLSQGEKYKVQKATCSDGQFTSDTCTVENDYEEGVTIKYNVGKYQVVTYSATDRLGNTSTVAIRVVVEQSAKTDTKLMLTFILSGCFLLLVFVILGWLLIKGKAKKEKMSYI